MKKFILLFLFILFTPFFLVSYWLFFDWSRHKNEFLTETTSADGRYTVEIYEANAHATTPLMILGVLIDNKTGKESKIYWAKGQHAMVEWTDTRTITINHKQLTVPYDTYDYRQDEER